MDIEKVRSRFIKHFDGKTGNIYMSPGRINGAFRFVVAYRCRINEHFNTGCGDFSPPKSCSYVCTMVKQQLHKPRTGKE